MTYDVIAQARRRTRRRATALAVAALAAAATVVAGAVLAGRQPTTAPAHASAPADISPAPGESAGAGMLPRDLAFTDVAGVRLPTSRQAGPHDTGGGLARGFTHDQAGAVLAAVHLLVRVAPQVGPTVFEPTLRDQVVGPDAQAMRAQVGRDYEELRSAAGATYGQPVGTLPAALRGFQLGGYRPEEATVRVLTDSAGADGTAVRVGCTVRMRWTGADWAMVAPPGGDFNTAVSLVSPADAAAFLPFAEGR